MIFSAFERLVAMRYLRARRQEGFVSVIALFSLLGIGLGVATLIVVMSVMNGFRAELLDRILGFNAHLSISANSGPVHEYDKLTNVLRALPSIASVSRLTLRTRAMTNVTIGARSLNSIGRSFLPSSFSAALTSSGLVGVAGGNSTLASGL